jgi:TonB family protein
MAFRALVFSKSPETNAAMTAACTTAGIRPEVCSDIFTAIEKGKTRAFSCVIVDWADQPEASFLLKRARESVPNRETVAVAIVDHHPKPAEVSDNRLEFLICRPIAPDEAHSVLAKACEQMKPMSAEDAREAFEENRKASSEAPSVGSSATDATEPPEADQPANFPETHTTANDAYFATDGTEAEPRDRSHAIGFRGVCAAVLAVAAVFFLWQSRDVVAYLARTPEGGFRVLRESFASLFYMNKTGASPVSSAGTDAQQDAYFSRGPSSNTQPLSLGVAATESTLTEDARIPLPKAPDFPLPRPVLERQDPPPMHIQRAAIPDSMKNSAPIERPVVVTVNPAQMMPVSAPQPQPAVQQEFNEPVEVSEEAARALLIHIVNPVYPPEASAQKLHGPVVLQAVIGRDGSVQDLKLVRGYFVLSKAAIAAVKQWRFQPYTLNGHAAATQTVITINFTYPPG